jgi:hypothetical protein
MKKSLIHERYFIPQQILIRNSWKKTAETIFNSLFQQTLKVLINSEPASSTNEAVFYSFSLCFFFLFERTLFSENVFYESR